MSSYTYKNLNHGRAFAVLSGLLYSLLGYFGIKLSNLGMSAFNMSFWRFLTAWIFLAIVCLIKMPKPFGKKSHIAKSMLGAMLFYSAPSSMFFIACQYIGSGQALVIFFVFPLWVVIINWLLGSEKFQSRYFLSFALTLVGLVLLVDMNEFRLDLVGIGLSLLCSLSYALYIVFNKKTDLSPMSSSVSVLFSCALTCGIIALVHGSLAWPESQTEWSNVIMLGIFCTALPVLLLFLALKIISSEEAAFLAVLEPVFAVIFGVLLLSEIVRINTFFGIVLILLGALSVSIDWPALVYKKQKRKIDGT